MHDTPMPLDILAVLAHGFWRESVLATMIVLAPIAIIQAYLKGGLYRIISMYSSIGLLGLLIIFWMGVLAFQFIDDAALIWPWEIFTLWDYLREDADVLHLFLKTEIITCGIAASLAFFYVFERFRPQRKALGDAHFANGLEVYKSGFLKPEAERIIIGKKYGAPLYSNGFEHVLVFAPSGSGKTRSISIPNLFHYPNSVVCNDVKFTLFETTAGYREKVLGHTCYCFAPARKSGVTHRFNPLSMISRDKLERITDIQRIAHILIPDNPKDPFWPKESRKLFKALTLYLLDTEDQAVTLGAMNRLVKQENFDEWLQDTLDNTDHLDPEFYRNGYSYINNPHKTRGNILSEFTGYLELFDDPFVDSATSASDFDFTDLRRKKMTIYIGFSDDDMERLAPLLNLFWQQLISTMIREIPDPVKEPYPLLCLIDEFSSLGRIERLRRSLKLLREYRVRCILMFQYIAQTYEKYSHDEAKAFINIKTKIAYTTEDYNDAEFISKMLGTRTQKVVTWGISEQSQGMSQSKNISYQAIPLLRPDKIMKLPLTISLIIRSGTAPIKARQFIWYQEAGMKHLALPAPEVPRQEVVRRGFARLQICKPHPSKYKIESSCID